MTDIKGLATGIGSLPHTDTEAALDLIFKYTPQIPFWPQLPKRDKREGMVIQYSEGLPCLCLKNKDLVFDSSKQDQELAQFYEHIISQDSEYFKISPDFSAGFWQFIRRLENRDLNQVRFIKGQITGPLTFAASINDSQGKAILHNPVLMQAVREGLVMKARWQINLLKKFGKPMIMFLDEPYLACFGSAFTAIDRNQVVVTLSELTEKIKLPEVLIGVHCCGNTDWSIFTEVPNIDIISFDAFGFLDKVLLYAKDLVNFFERGGILAWGIVPTQAFSPEIKYSALEQRLKQGCNSLINKGIDKELIKKSLILTPSCGLGALDHEKAEPIFKCLAELSSAVCQ